MEVAKLKTRIGGPVISWCTIYNFALPFSYRALCKQLFERYVPYRYGGDCGRMVLGGSVSHKRFDDFLQNVQCLKMCGMNKKSM